MGHVNQGRHFQAEIKLYFRSNNSLKGQRDKTTFNVEALVAFKCHLMFFFFFQKMCGGMLNSGYICLEFFIPCSHNVLIWLQPPGCEISMACCRVNKTHLA